MCPALAEEYGYRPDPAPRKRDQEAQGKPDLAPKFVHPSVVGFLSIEMEGGRDDVGRRNPEHVKRRKIPNDQPRAERECRANRREHENPGSYTGGSVRLVQNDSDNHGNEQQQIRPDLGSAQQKRGHGEE